ncbi:MAG: class D sortase [Bacilli bacterium]|nr:class D sortase [Bacilli bacterium]
MEKTITIINKLSIPATANNESNEDIKFDKIKKRLSTYPNYGDKFGSVEISSIGVDVVLYHGESLKILKYGLGHHAGSYFPGEGGTILIAGHNTFGMFYNLPKIKIGDNILVRTLYGDYSYKVIKTDIKEASVLTKEIKVNNKEEILVLYTCYPVEIPGYKSKRFVAYAKLVGDSNEE